ncbi:hypothetical protein DNI29_16755 [Hymenobacter sediminis]|uniref:hypothetical protein n=1 Tax=Hymenobacter sediminis TaxID=2218621 RepID=UPI000DA6521C|nr:hypothetical protein [Hymenobacter sediminis]RPD45800.1 hypothetical protein DNI29_16755 [Hymenobacter sediminis]
MPKTIDYPRTSYSGAWEVAEIVDDTGGKCAIETAARKLNRKVSGSFKAIIGSAVKFGLLTSKRELLTTTNLFRRIKHAYDKQEEKIYHREAFLHPPLFTQICRKFRNRELPVHMFDVMLIREFGVEEINAQGVAKAFVDGARMAGILDERNVIVDIDQLAAQQTPRRELASSEMPLNIFRADAATPSKSNAERTTTQIPDTSTPTPSISGTPAFVPTSRIPDAVSSLFGLDTTGIDSTISNQANAPIGDGAGPEAVFIPAPETSIEKPSVTINAPATSELPVTAHTTRTEEASHSVNNQNLLPVPPRSNDSPVYSIHISGPGLDTQLSVQELADLDIVGMLLEKIRRRLSN